MAEALFNKLSKKNRAESAGTNVDNEGQTLDNTPGIFVIKVLKEEGIDVRKKVRNQLTEEMVDSYDKVVVITSRDDCPDYLKKNDKVIFWDDIADAKGTDYDFHVRTRDEIKRRVKKLLSEIDDQTL